MSVADQAAIVAAQAAQNTATATWWLFGATVVLVAVSLAAVVVGGLAARRATETYRLEAEPVLIVTERDDFQDDDLPRYIVCGTPSLADGLVLKLWSPADEPMRPPGSPPPDRYSGIQRPAKVLFVENVGRSPAVDVELDVTVSTLLAMKPGSSVKGFVPNNEPNDSNEWIQTGTQYGAGVIKIPAIASQRIARVRIVNYIGLQVRVKVAPVGRQVRWDSASRSAAAIAVISPTGDTALASPTG